MGREREGKIKDYLFFKIWEIEIVVSLIVRVKLGG